MTKKLTKPTVGHSRGNITRAWAALSSRTVCGLSEFDLPPGHRITLRRHVSCTECLSKMAARRKPVRVEDKALVDEHFDRAREVKQAEKAGPQ